MFLNLDIIADELFKTYHITRYGSECKDLTLRRPCLYFSDEPMIRNALYILHTQNFPKFPPDFPVSVICTGSRVPANWISGGQQILHIRESVDPLKVFSQVQDLYNTFDDWDIAIRDEIEKYENFNLKRIIEIGVLMLKNPICVCDQFLQYMFTSDIVWNSDGTCHVTVNDTHNPFPVNGLDNVKEFCRLEKQNRRPYLTAAKVVHPPENHKTYCNNLYPMEHFAGCIYLKEIYHLFHTSDYLLADYFFVYFQKAFLKYLYRVSCSESRENVALLQLIAGNSLNEEERKLFELLPDEYWLCFTLRERRGTHYMPKDYMYAILNTIMPQNIYTVLRNQEIIGILRICDGNEEKKTSNIDMFCKLIERMGYIAGVSNEFTNIQEVKNYLLQASYAADYLSCNSANETCIFFKDHILQYMISSCTNEFPGETLYTKPLRILIGNDEEKGTDYIQTLNVCLKNEMNMTKSANELFIHRTSLLKRMERIESLVGKILETPDERLYFRLCFRLMGLD